MFGRLLKRYFSMGRLDLEGLWDRAQVESVLFWIPSWSLV